ncbi:hypothetical protein BOSEA31B_10927 [Hyphomicrobiales bacterium]|nr:hypothetical protein BOSEA31B_10927 [Hyphomicrobiales bacterium]CAH1700778.1 hypothetical protein BOSEA1005_20477 [Hyphomicrobiales bacterium]CAI0344651.1 hypothetical protein BO1005MUT1_350018 [Hyphomicrobiales bacterium]
MWGGAGVGGAKHGDRLGDVPGAAAMAPNFPTDHQEAPPPPLSPPHKGRGRARVASVAVQSKRILLQRR